MKLIPTILCGGLGSRLWPVSRPSRPKPFITLADGQTLLQKTYARAVALPHAAEILTVAGREHYFHAEDEVRKCGAVLPQRFLLEPMPRNTAAAIALAALEVQQTHGEDAVMLVLPADHVIENMDAFQTAVTDATKLAAQGQLVTFGIRPTHAETGFGYIETQGARAVRMIEKPDAQKAQEYVAAGNYFWNAGMFCFTAGALIREMHRHALEVVNGARHALAYAARRFAPNAESVELFAEDFSRIPEISIDYAVMEHTENLAVVPCDLGWRDIGSWNALAALTPPDASGNRVQGDAVLRDTHHCYVQSGGRVIGCVGLSDMVIVATDDAILVAAADRAQEVKHLFQQLQAQGHAASQEHTTAHRPWGTYRVLEVGAGFKIKRIEVKPGGRLSLQSHRQRSEHWIVLRGVASVTQAQRHYTVHANQSTYIPAGELHRLSNLGKEPLVIIEIQTGAYVGEDDIRRYDDAYGREVEFS